MNPSDEQPILSIIVPVYNEQNTLQSIIKRIMDVKISQEIIVVDDGSTDDTPKILQRIIKNHQESGGNKKSRLKVFTHEKNKGKGAAIRTALPHLEGIVGIIQDADNEYNPEEYSKVIQPILDGKADAS